ncbi:MAG: DNRLRE domain-containing protein, partial [Winogradskyella sp.]|nr:DNRLRE domain-containing protein [Winogradskyella sp.]
MNFFLVPTKYLGLIVVLLISFTTIAQQRVTCDFVATQDTYIKLKNTGTNYGSCNTLTVDREKNDLHRILVQFDLSSIPAGSVIESAELRLYTDNGNNMDISVFQISASDVWNEGAACGSSGAANWTNRTTTASWSTTGVVGPFNGGTPIQTINGNADGIHSWTITSLTQQWINGTAVNNGVMIGSQDGGGDRTVDYNSRESSGIKPTLRITYNINLDSDYDGIMDSVDIDDDNDGILDTDECDTIVNPPLQNPDFEAIDIMTLDGGPTDVVPTSGIWKGDASHIPNWLSADTTNNYLEIWHNSQAAGNDAGGQAYSGTHWAEVNATTNDGLYQDIVSTPGNVLQWAFAHRKRTGYAGSSNEDVVRLLIGDPSGTLTSQGDFTSAGDSSWTLHTGTYTVPPGQTTTRLTFTVLSTASGSTSSGNFIDNVQLYVIPDDCADNDGDSIPDYFDLDSDNDGIPDIVEAGHGSISNGTGTIPLTSFVDTNGNGLHDAFEGLSPLDSDGDGVPNYRDLDSDNDTIFDVDEAGTERYSGSLLTHDNGDGDIDGDGVGDGLETESFRVMAVEGSCIAYFGDGILDIYDFGNGSNEYGNLNQGTGPLYVKDTDNDGIPDYIDIQSNGSSFDIANTLYANLDANNDGIIDDNTDSDGDGILDLFDTDDSSFGSPRDIDTKLQVYFDGRNDYIQDASLTSGWNEITLMGWIKIDASTNERFLFGQSNFYLKLNSGTKLQLFRNGSLISTGTTLAQNQWIHVAASYSSANEQVVIYINGDIVKTSTVSGSLNTDASPFTIGKQPTSSTEYFKGYIDEVRLYNKALSTDELQKMVYQEIENNAGNVHGAVIPRDITQFIDPSTIIPLSWSNLIKYYRLDTFKDDITDNLKTPAIDDTTGARLYNIKTLKLQTAPMPFRTTSSGYLPDALDKMSDGINGSDATTYDWSIVSIEHDDVYYDQQQKHLGLFINELDSASNAIEYTVNNDTELNVSWYLKLDGKLDLEGESQLIQGYDSQLDVGTNGKLERDQQGTADTFTYNYWSSPVGATETGTNAYKYALNEVLHDGDVPVTFTSSYNGANTTPLTIAHYWIWKYANNLSNTYSAWQHIRHTGPINAGEGFTMKGPGSGAITDEQNYVFKGKPNNGDINLTLNAGNDYL